MSIPNPNRSKTENQVTELFLRIGKIEGYSYLILLGVAMPLKYLFSIPEGVRVIGLIHGILFIAFVALLALMMGKAKLSPLRSFICFLLSLIPFGTFYLRKWI